MLRAPAAGVPTVDDGDALDRPLPADPADRAKQQALVREHVEFVWRALWRLGVPRAGLDDAVQQVFLVAIRKLDSIVAGSERSFLFGVALRVASDARRLQKRLANLGTVPTDTPVADDAQQSPGPQADELLDRKRARELLDAALASMPMELRAVFVLYELEELTMAQIAEMLSLPPGTVASRLRRAREQFHAIAARLQAGPKPQGGDE